MINTAKGHLIFEAIKDKLTLKPITKEYSWQSKLEYPIVNNPLSEVFWQDYQDIGFERVARKYWEYSLLKYYKRRYLRRLLGIPSLIVHKILKK